MANELCVFYGQKPGTFRSTTVACGNTIQVACKSCEKELKGLDEAEICRKALIRGIAENPDRIRARIELRRKQRIIVPNACVVAPILHS